MPEIRVPGMLTLAGLLGGLLIGLLLRGSPAMEAVLDVAGPVGDLWLKALKMTILPLVAGLLFTGIVETAAAARASALAKRTMGFIGATLALSAILGATLMPLLLSPSAPPTVLAPPASPSVVPQVPGFGDFLLSLQPSNILTSAADDALLPVIVFVALLAVASLRLDDAPRRQLALLFEAVAGAMMIVIGWVLRAAPLGVFALGLSLAALSGTAVLGALAHYIVVVSLCGAVFLVLAYPLAVLAGRKRLGAFALAVLPAQVVAVSTQSSLASLPAMLASCRRLKVATTTAEFVLPLAVTLFRATSPAMNVGAVIYAARLSGTDLPPGAIAAGAFVAFVTTFGSVSLPGTVSFIASTGPIAAAMGVPLWPLGILVAVEMLPDLMRTIGNVTMDVAVTAGVDRSQNDAQVLVSEEIPR